MVDELVIEYRGEDARVREIAPLYWTRGKDRLWAHRVTDLAKQYGYKSHQTLSAVLKASTVVYPKAWCCPNCGRPTRYLRVREGFHYSHIDQFAGERCGICEPKSVDAPPEPESFAEERIDRLDSLQFAFLQGLATTGDVQQAARRVGVSNKHGQALHEELKDLQLIEQRMDRLEQILEVLSNALQQLDARPRVKSIFTSPRIEKLYRQLKREHLFVFPEVPLAAIIERAGVAHLFTERWHADYFLKSRLDFVVTDHGGTPYLAIEYQGGYHQNRDVQRLDRFKKSILDAVGLKLKTLTARDL